MPDPDGLQIKNLLFNIFWYICPELILNGHVYSSQPPLFKVITKKNDYVYLHDQEDLDRYKETHGSEIKVIERNKGLGSSSAEELSIALLQKDTRKITKLTSLEDVKEIDKTFQDLYGKKVEPRVKFLLDHSDDITIDME